MYNVLFDCLIKYRRINVNSKNSSLIIKCLLKLTKDLVNKITKLDLDMMFAKFNEYLVEFAPDPNKN
jgi:ssDNA-specific exonuclease RecJ